MKKTSCCQLCLPFLFALATLCSATVAAESRLTTEQIVVTATRTEQNSFDLPVSIDSVSGETIRGGLPGMHLTETSVRIPGVVVNNRHNASQDLAVSSRGFGARSAFGVRGVRLYADGIPLSMPDGQGQTGTFSFETAKSLEFMRGPFSALYGNSSGGVVQLFTRDGDPAGAISGSVSTGSYDTLKAGLVAEGQVGGLNYLLSAIDLRSDGYREHSRNDKQTLHAKLNYEVGAGTRITLLGTSMDQFAEDPLGLTATQYQQNPRQAGTNAVARDTRVYRKHSQLGGTIEHRVSSESTIKALLYGGKRDNRQYQQLGATGRVVTIGRDFSGADLRWTHRSDASGMPLTLVAGLSYDRMEDVRQQNNAAAGVIGVLTREDLQRVHNFDQYLQATLEPSERWLVVAGLRHTNVRFDLGNRFASVAVTSGNGTLDFSNASPVIGATYRLSPMVNLYANVGKGFETPTTIEVSYTGDPSAGGATTGPNLTIQPSVSKNYEAGVKALVADAVRINAALFRVDTDREIVLDQGQGTTASFKNAGRTRRQGIELSFDAELPANVAIYGAMTWTDARFIDGFLTSGNTVSIAAGNRVPGTYRRTTYGEVAWRHPGSGFNAALETIQFSDTFTNDTNVQKADAYGVFNLRAGFTQKLGGWIFREFARIENLTNRGYVSSIRVNAAQNTTGAAFEPGAPRNWLLGATASYQF